MKLIRSLIYPWFLYFVVAVASFIYAGTHYPQLQLAKHPWTYAALAMGAIACLMSNFGTLARVGIWLREALPESLRFTAGRWVLKAIEAFAIAAAFWFVGKIPAMPLLWHAFVIPIVLTIALFMAVTNLIGPILQLSSNVPASRLTSVVLSLPVYALIPFTALLIGVSVASAYRASQADFVVSDGQVPVQRTDVDVKGQILSTSFDKVRLVGEWPVGSGEQKTLEIETKLVPPRTLTSLSRGPSNKEVSISVPATAVQVSTAQPAASDEELRSNLRSDQPAVRAQALRSVYERSKSCEDYTKEIQASLNPQGDAQVVYWASRAVDCAAIRSIIALPRLVEIMLHHNDGQTRAAAIRAFRKYNNEQVGQVSYLLVKRISENEPGEVVEATANVMATLDEKNRKWAAGKLQTLLDSETLGTSAARTLIRDYGQDDMVAEYVSTHLGGAGEQQKRAVEMICLLPEGKRSVAQPYSAQIVSSLQKAEMDDPAMRALDCMGKAGYEALRAEMKSQNANNRSLIAEAMVKLDIKRFPGAMEIAENCVSDDDDRVQKACAQILGELGAPALPKILTLLRSGDNQEKQAGQEALAYLSDPKAKEDLQKIVDANSGWLANNRRMQIAKAAGTALARIEHASEDSTSATTREAE